MLVENKPILLFDGDCGFCRRWIARWQAMTGDRVSYYPYQEVASQFPQVSMEDCQKAVQLVEGNKVTQGAEAVYRSLSHAPGQKWLLWLYEKVAPFRMVSEWFYRLVAERRVLFSNITRLLWGDYLLPPTYRFAAWLFLKALAVIYFIAFLSLSSQILGLIGSQGILPAVEFLAYAKSKLGGVTSFFLVPTLFWFNTSNFSLVLLSWLGIAGSIALFVGFYPRILSLLLWFFYLSFVSIGQEFFSFQWDVLLLEAGFLAIFLAPHLKKLPHWERLNPSSLFIWLYRWLLFRLMFSSGIVKLLSGDTSWRNLTAMNFHYETQPLPTWTSWFMHHLPSFVHRFEALAMFGVEILGALLIFAPRRLKLIAFTSIVSLQTVIMLTGNYCFFNWLTIALCLFLIDDAMWPGKWIKMSPLKSFSGDSGANYSGMTIKPKWGKYIVRSFGIFILFLSLIQFIRTLNFRFWLPPPVMTLFAATQPYRSINSYGLFAVMTTSRPEIILEGSFNGVTWKSYEFRYKPGDPKKAPQFVAPHQPRVDWQMWFAALDDYRQNPWLINMCFRLLKGSKDVSGLLKTNPFEKDPPQYIRAMVYEYYFSSPAELFKTGQWWVRKEKGQYAPTISFNSQTDPSTVTL